MFSRHVASTELDGSESTDASRADQMEFVRGAFTAAELGDRVRQRYGIGERRAGSG
ncbi:hypothetical protein [Mycolicibacterium chubuense]|uniref:antitoxin VbhA family protein n=1 Tax=Mycolicibacterium chubuense TaxID=1800 RepID=UPI003D187C82